jgi:hypothetical protein
MTFLDPVRLPQPSVTPTAMLGAASPLWAWFGAATAGGLAYWWMTQWTRPANLEALFEAAGLAVPTREAVEEAVVAPAAAMMEAALEATPPVGGESAPVSPLVAEAVVALSPTPAAEPAGEPEPTPRPRKSGPSSPTVN